MKLLQKVGNNEKGFTLVEAVIAAAVLGIGIFSFYAMQVRSIDGNAKAARITYGTSWASDQIENLLALDFDDALLDDDDLDGTNRDANGDGVDDSGNNFGLNDTGAQADGSLASPDGLYTIFWNVAVDQRMPDLKSIRVIIDYAGIGTMNDIVMDYIKPEM